VVREGAHGGAEVVLTSECRARSSEGRRKTLQELRGTKEDTPVRSLTAVGVHASVSFDRMNRICRMIV
jgi:hypothetical protein